MTLTTITEARELSKSELNTLIADLENYKRSILFDETVEYAYKLRVTQCIGALIDVYFLKFIN